MLAQWGSTIERIRHRIEEHVEERRKEEAARHAEVEALRDQLWAEAAERERLLAQTIGEEEEARRTSVEEVAKRQQRVFVAHSEEAAEALRDFAREGEVRLVKVIAGRESHANGSAIKGSWLIFEASE